MNEEGQEESETKKVSEDPGSFALPLWDASQCLSSHMEEAACCLVMLCYCVFLGRETLREEELEKQRQSHPANFGPRKYCLRECMCEVEGQVPCPGLVPLPKEMTGKYKAALKAST